MDDESEFSDAYDKLVNSPDDIVGKIAYAEYRKQKIELIVEKNYDTKHESISGYHNDLNQGRVNSLRNDANITLKLFSNGIIAEALEKEGEQVRTGVLTDSLLKHIDKNTKDLENKIRKSTSLTKAIFINVLASFVFAGILTAAFYIGWINPIYGPSASQKSGTEKISNTAISDSN